MAELIPLDLESRPIQAEHLTDRAGRLRGVVAGMRTAALECRSVVMLHLPLLMLVGGFILSTWLLPSHLRPDFSIGDYVPWLWFSLFWLVCLVPIHGLWVLRTGHHGGSIMRAEAWRAFRVRYLSARRVASALLIIAILAPFIRAFARWKLAIPTMNPFSWDPLLMRADKALHFGHDPWELLHAIASPQVTVMIDWIYHPFWMTVFPLVLIWQIWSSAEHLRQRFFLCSVLMWVVLGVGLATLLSSAGPCYFDAVTGQPGPYAPLMAHLERISQSHPLWSFAGQRTLWGMHTEPQGGFELGISAMPSMHVALASLFALLALRTHRLLAIGFGAFVILTIFGSVYLGWHYAVDGYMSMAIVPMIWWVCGRFVGWYARRTERSRDAFYRAQQQTIHAG